MPQPIDISADIVEVYEDNTWKPITKRGKLPGAKQVYRKRPGLNDIITLLDKPGVVPSDYTPILRRYIEDGKILVEPPSLEEIRKYVLEQLAELPELTPI
jgi:nicotinate phosphoribosyltransferase